MKQLFIAYNFYPLNSPEAIQNERIMRALSKLGVKTHVVTHYDSENRELENSDILVSRTNVKDYKLRKVFCYFFNKKRIQRPDTKYFWKSEAISICEDLMEKENYDFVHSWSTPITSHIVALELRKKKDFKWIVHFSDPWTENPYITYVDKETKEYNQKLEEEVLSLADAIVYTSIETKDLMVGKYNGRFAEKSYILPHTYSPNVVDRYINEKYDDKLIHVAHVGNFYGKRIPDELFMGIKKAKEKVENLSETVCVDLVGNLPKSKELLIQKLGIGDVVKVHGKVPYNESQKIMAKSSVLLNIDAKDEISVFLPSKLVEYIGYDKPILAITPIKGTTSRVLNELNHIAIPNENYDEIANCFVEMSKNGISGFDYLSTGREKYLPDYVANEFKNIVDKIID
ncbi:MAG: glycosyltransferase [Acidaminobacteraceae bacterium]